MFLRYCRICNGLYFIFLLDFNVAKSMKGEFEGAIMCILSAYIGEIVGVFSESCVF